MLKKIKPKNEKELHSIIEKGLEALEKGLVLLKYEFALTKGIPDNMWFKPEGLKLTDIVYTWSYLL